MTLDDQRPAVSLPEPPPRLAPSRPFPATRYLPGRGPHPRHDAVPAAAPSTPPTDDLAYAIDLFNHRFFWEAHEVWEGLWRSAVRDAPERPALQGLIQTAAALLKTEMRHGDAAARLAAAALGNLERARRQAGTDRVLGLDLAAFAARFAAHHADPARAPFPFLIP